jgi:hypothetical protein
VRRSDDSQEGSVITRRQDSLVKLIPLTPPWIRSLLPAAVRQRQANQPLHEIQEKNKVTKQNSVLILKATGMKSSAHHEVNTAEPADRPRRSPGSGVRRLMRYARTTVLRGAIAAGFLFALAPQAANAAPVDGFCTADQVMVWTNRVHVRCATPVGSIKYFAISTSDQAQAARVLSVINTALVAGRTLTIRHDPADLSGASIGCLTSDCRLIQAIGFGQ